MTDERRRPDIPSVLLDQVLRDQFASAWKPAVGPFPWEHRTDAGRWVVPGEKGNGITVHDTKNADAYVSSSVFVSDITEKA